MAIPVARVHLPMAHAALPGLLPTPPKNAMMPSPAACIPILPAKKSPSKSTMPGRADAAERLDAHKTKPASTSSSGSSSPRSTSSCSSSSSPGRASSCERWDSNKTPSTASSSASSRQHRDSSKRAAVSRASSAERWDLHKKPRNKTQAIYAGPGFLTSPEPGMLPVPTFMVRAR